MWRWVLKAALCVACASASWAHAFCVGQNGVSGETPFFRVEGAPNRHFQARPVLDEKACCNWQEKSCNPSGERGHFLELTVWQHDRIERSECHYTQVGLMCRETEYGPMCKTRMPAGGSARLRQEGKQLLLRVYHVDGSLVTEGKCVDAQRPYDSMITNKSILIKP
jgi:hypothetical protein